MKNIEDKRKDRGLTRRDFFKLGGQGAIALMLGGAVGLGGAGLGRELGLGGVAEAATTNVYRRLAATDGFIKTPDGKDHYIFGFTNFINIPPSIQNFRLPAPRGRLTRAQKAKFNAKVQTIKQQKITNYLTGYRGKARLTAPIIDITEGDHFYLTLTNLGMPHRPDLEDSHTLHFHGFPNAAPIFDGVPDQTFSVPVNRSFTYYYNLREPGSYPYHCHFEDTEHIQMGMVGSIIVRPQQGSKYAYNDGLPDTDPASTRFDREYVLFISELDSVIHKRLETVQEGQNDWTDYNPDYWLLNGRAYPDTLKPNDDPSLPSQPVSSLIEANAGERVLLRLISLGYQEHAIELPGIPLRVVGEDARMLRGPGNPGADLSYTKNVLNVQPGTTFDAIFQAPDVAQKTTYSLFDRALRHTTSAGASGGMMTEVRVHPAGTLGPQGGPNQ